jgi:hypothetical protein
MHAKEFPCLTLPWHQYRSYSYILILSNVHLLPTIISGHYDKHQRICSKPVYEKMATISVKYWLLWPQTSQNGKLAFNQYIKPANCNHKQPKKHIIKYNQISCICIYIYVCVYDYIRYICIYKWAVISVLVGIFKALQSAWFFLPRVSVFGAAAAPLVFRTFWSRR